MKKVWCILMVLILMGVFVLADDKWDSFESNSMGESEPVSYKESNNVEILNDSSIVDNNNSGKWGLSDSSLDLPGGYNKNFYYAILVIVVFLLIFLAFLYFFLRGPRNRWEG